MDTLMVMFFNWVDLWLAVSIILSFTPAGWKNHTGQLKPEGAKNTEWKRGKKGKHHSQRKCTIVMTQCRRVPQGFQDIDKQVKGRAEGMKRQKREWEKDKESQERKRRVLNEYRGYKNKMR